MINHDYIKINKDSSVPKYKQIIESIRASIANRQLLMGDQIMSINALSKKFNISRDTVQKAYNELRLQNVIVSEIGKGYYISKTDLSFKIDVLFLMNKLSTYKMQIYNSFVNTLGINNANIDLHIFHCEPQIFINILTTNKKHYDYFVVMPNFRNEKFQHVGCSRDILKLLNKIPKTKLIILDREIKSVSTQVGKVYQDFTYDIYNTLKSSFNKLKKYPKIMLVYPNKAAYPYPKEIVIGFKKFCIEKNQDFEILNKIDDDMILHRKGLYIIIQEEDLVNLIQLIRKYKYKLGKDIGIISYNDTPLKKILGITVISTDFNKMGSLAAQMIQNQHFYSVKNNFDIIYREST